MTERGGNGWQGQGQRLRGGSTAPSSAPAGSRESGWEFEWRRLSAGGCSEHSSKALCLPGGLGVNSPSTHTHSSAPWPPPVQLASHSAPCVAHSCALTPPPPQQHLQRGGHHVHVAAGLVVEARVVKHEAHVGQELVGVAVPALVNAPAACGTTHTAVSGRACALVTRAAAAGTSATCAVWPPAACARPEHHGKPTA